MKKRHLFLGLALATCLIGGASVGIVNNIKTNNEIHNIQLKLNDAESTEEESSKIEALKNKISELMNNQLITSIVSYSTSISGVLGFIITFFKYRKYKAINNEQVAEIVAKVGVDELVDKYEELEKKVVSELTTKFGDIESAISVLQKVMILAQDTTTKGKVALMEYLEKKVEENPSTTEDVKETVAEVKAQAEEAAKVEEEITEEAKADYTPIE